MNEKTTNLLNNREKLKEEIEELKQENNEFNLKNKRFNKRMFKLFLIDGGLLLPMALYTIPIIPTTTTIAGETIKGLAPIFPKIDLDLLMYPTFIGGFGIVGTSIAFTLENILFYLPMKIAGIIKEHKLYKKKRLLNDEIIKEYEKIKNSNLNNNYSNNSKKTNNITNNKTYKYSHNYYKRTNYIKNTDPNKKEIKTKIRRK